MGQCSRNGGGGVHEDMCNEHTCVYYIGTCRIPQPFAYRRRGTFSLGIYSCKPNNVSKRWPREGGGP